MTIEHHGGQFMNKGLPIGEQDHFCIPKECCPERIPTPSIPSPTSCLPQEELEELEERIEAANRLLLDLGLSDRGNGFDEQFEELDEEARMRAFDGLLGQIVKVKINCEEEQATAASKLTITNPVKADKPKRKKRIKQAPKLSRRKRRTPTVKKGTGKKRAMQQTKRTVEGRVHLVGRNFVLLRQEEREYLIPLLKICSILPKNQFAQPPNEEDLRCIDPCFRRALAFRFGETVASSPELIQLFYRIPLNIYLLTLEGKKIKVKLPNKLVVGTLKEVDKEQIRLCLKNDKKRNIPLDQVCYISF